MASIEDPKEEELSIDIVDTEYKYPWTWETTTLEDWETFTGEIDENN